MPVKVNSEFIFIGKDDESFLENYSYELSDDPHGKGGKIFVGLEVLHSEADAEEIGEAIFETLKEHFYVNLEKEPYFRFEDALKKVNDALEGFKGDNPDRFAGNLNVVIAALAGDELLLSQFGDAEAYLIRKRFVSVITDGLNDDASEDIFVNIASGTLEPGDKVLLSSSRVLRYISKQDLAKIFSNRDAGEALSELQDYVLTEILGKIGVIALQCSDGGGAEAEGRGALDDFLNGEGEERGALANDSPRSRFTSKFTGSFPKLSSARIGSLFKRLKLPGGLAQKLAERGGLPNVSMRDMSKDRLLIILIVVVVFLLGSVYWLRTRGNQQKFIEEMEAKLQHVQDLIDESSSVGSFDKEQAAQLLSQAEQEALTVLNSRYLRSKAAGTLTEIKNQRNLLDNVTYVAEPAITIDVSSKRSNVDLLGMTFLKDRLYAFEYNGLYEIILDRLQDPLTISDTETVMLGEAFDDQNGIVFATKTGKMIEYSGGTFQFVDTADGIWKRGVDIETYGQRLYMLDPANNQVWRYTRRRDNYDGAESYNVDADLSDAVSMAIDGSIYVLHADGFITKLYVGEKQSFPLRKEPLVPVENPTKIYTDENLNQIFVLDPAQKRVVLYDKDVRNEGAVYSGQYIFENAGELHDVYVNRDENRMYVADAQKIYVVELGSAVGPATP